MTTAERLAEIERRANEATPAPWDIGEDDDTVYSNPRPGRRGGTMFDAQICQMLEDMDTDEVNWRDAEFICEARDDVPWLLQQVRQLQSERDRAAELLRFCAKRYSAERDEFAHHPEVRAFLKELER